MKNILLVLALATLFSACKKEPIESVEPVKSVKTITITESAKANSRQISGIVKSANESTLSFRVGGRVLSVNVNIGDNVVIGQILATLQQREFKLAVQTAQAKLASVRADLLEKTDALKRQQNLSKKNYVPQTAVVQAQAAYTAAKSNVDVARTELQNTQNDLTNTKLKAPFSGTISSRSVDAFNEVSAGNSIFNLQSDGALVVEMLLPETLIRDINHGDAVRVTFPTLKDANVSGIISEIGANAETGNAFPVKIELAKTPADIRSGMTAKVTLNFGEAAGDSVYLIPVSALDVRIPIKPKTNSDNKVAVFVFENGVVKKKLISIRDIRGNQFEVVDGLKTGDVLIVAGVPYLTEGQKVKQWEPTFNMPATINQKR